MVMSIDYLWVYDPAVSLCILKSTQIIGSTNFVFVAPGARKFLRGEARTDGVRGNNSGGKRGGGCEPELTTTV